MGSSSAAALPPAASDSIAPGGPDTPPDAPPLTAAAAASPAAAGTAPATQPAAATAAKKGVLLIGDSLTVGTKPFLTQQLAGQPVEIDATSGIPLAEGMRRYDAHKDKPRVVEMALFTNNAPGQKAELQAAIEKTIADARARGGKVVWATIVRPNGDYGPVNDMIRDYAAKNPDVMGLVDWAKMVQANPSYVGKDGIHSGPAGYTARAKAFADAAR